MKDILICLAMAFGGGAIISFIFAFSAVIAKLPFEDTRLSWTIFGACFLVTIVLWCASDLIDKKGK